ncbi:MAG: hypothetical protein AB8F95_21590 [Bacteroidia bacterium]
MIDQSSMLKDMPKEAKIAILDNYARGYEESVYPIFEQSRLSIQSKLNVYDINIDNLIFEEMSIKEYLNDQSVVYDEESIYCVASVNHDRYQYLTFCTSKFEGIYYLNAFYVILKNNLTIEADFGPRKGVDPSGALMYASEKYYPSEQRFKKMLKCMSENALWAGSESQEILKDENTDENFVGGDTLLIKGRKSHAYTIDGENRQLANVSYVYAYKVSRLGAIVYLDRFKYKIDAHTGEFPPKYQGDITSVLTKVEFENLQSQLLIHLEKEYIEKMEMLNTCIK